jgi:hypothetical protein
MSDTMPGYTGSLRSDGRLYVHVQDSVSGFGEAYVPVASEIQAYFNGWKAKTIDGTGKPTAWKNIVTGADAPTQTNAYVSANRAPGFTPYKLSYVLATPVIEDVSNKVEGDISVNGLTQVELGAGTVVREKANPKDDKLSIPSFRINNTYQGDSKLTNKASKIFAIYKNGIIDNKWTITSSTDSSFAHGTSWAKIPKTDFDTTAEYTVTYQVLDRNIFTITPYNAKATYSKNIRSALDETVNKVENNTRDLSILVGSMTEFYKRLKALGG